MQSSNYDPRTYGQEQQQSSTSASSAAAIAVAVASRAASASSTSSSSGSSGGGSNNNLHHHNYNNFEFEFEHPQLYPPSLLSHQTTPRRSSNNTYYQVQCLRRYMLELDLMETETKVAQLRDVILHMKSRAGYHDHLPCPGQFNPVIRFTDKGSLRFRFIHRQFGNGDQETFSGDQMVNDELDKLSNRLYSVIYEVDQKLMQQQQAQHLNGNHNLNNEFVGFNNNNNNEFNHPFSNTRQGICSPWNGKSSLRKSMKTSNIENPSSSSTPSLFSGHTPTLSSSSSSSSTTNVNQQQQNDFLSSTNITEETSRNLISRWSKTLIPGSSTSTVSCSNDFDMQASNLKPQNLTTNNHNFRPTLSTEPKMYNCIFDGCEGFESPVKSQVFAHVQAIHYGDRPTQLELLEQYVQVVETFSPSAALFMMMMANQQQQHHQQHHPQPTGIPSGMMNSKMVVKHQHSTITSNFDPSSHLHSTATTTISSPSTSGGRKTSSKKSTKISLEIPKPIIPFSIEANTSFIPLEHHQSNSNHNKLLNNNTTKNKTAKPKVTIVSSLTQATHANVIHPAVHLVSQQIQQQHQQTLNNNNNNNANPTNLVTTSGATTTSGTAGGKGTKSKRKPIIPTYRYLNQYYTKSVNSRGRTEYRCRIGACTKRIISDWPKFRLHQHIHLSVRPFSCAFPGCEARFASAQRTHVLRHLLLRHLHHLNTNKLSAPAIQKYVRVDEDLLEW